MGGKEHLERDSQGESGNLRSPTPQSIQTTTIRNDSGQVNGNANSHGENANRNMDLEVGSRIWNRYRSKSNNWTRQLAHPQPESKHQDGINRGKTLTSRALAHNPKQRTRTSKTPCQQQEWILGAKEPRLDEFFRGTKYQRCWFEFLDPHLPRLESQGSTYQV